MIDNLGVFITSIGQPHKVESRPLFESTIAYHHALVPQRSKQINRCAAIATSIVVEILGCCPQLRNST